MKNIFKKNHIIITALAIMIVIAGYLSFTNKDTPDNKDMAISANQDTEDFGDAATATDGTDVIADTGDKETVNDAAVTDDVTADNASKDGKVTDASTDGKTDATADAATDADVKTADDSTTDVKTADATDETGKNDISDEDILASAQDVADNGELDLQDGVPGEAVLASAALDSSYFISTKLEREQTRAKNKETLMDMINSSELSEAQKKDAIDRMIALTEVAEKENAAEMLLGAKGFDGAVVFMVDNKVEVVVNAKTLSDQQLAIIEDVVKNETDVKVKNIHITPVVVAE